MKYIITALIAVASVATADIAVSAKTTAPVSTDGTPATYLAPGNLALLVWSASDNSGSTSVDTSGLAAGEVQLASLSGANAGVILAPASPTVYNDASVGGADINTGYLYVRIFQDSSIDAGDLYGVGSAVLGSSLTEYDSSVPSTIYSDSFNAAPLTLSNTVVPEPATIGLMGIAGLGMFAARRKVQG